jgi:hypothetical protein
MGGAYRRVHGILEGNIRALLTTFQREKKLMLTDLELESLKILNLIVCFKLYKIKFVRCLHLFVGPT